MALDLTAGGSATRGRPRGSTARCGGVAGAHRWSRRRGDLRDEADRNLGLPKMARRWDLVNGRLDGSGWSLNVEDLWIVAGVG